MKPVVLLTGANGFLGTQVARRLVGMGCDVVALVHAKRATDADGRLRRAWWDWPEIEKEIDRRVHVFAGDVAEPRLGLDPDVYEALVGRLTHIVHSAADWRLNGPLAEFRRTNVQGTRHILELGRAIRRDHGLTRLAHISTAYVCGRRSGDVPEEDLTNEYGFASNYERSKYEGELQVQAARDELPVSVFRPGMIVGDSQTGAIRTFNTVYVPLRMYLSGKLRFVPADPSLRLNIAPVDYVADAVAKMTLDDRAEGLIFHLCASPDRLPTAEELMTFVRDWARAQMGLRLPRLAFLPLAGLATNPLLLRRLAANRAIEGLLELAPYLNSRQRFQVTNTERLLGPYVLEWRDYLPKLLQFAVSRSFLHPSGRTVHEQILYRLDSHHHPVTYYDMTPDGTRERSAAAVQNEIMAAASSLRALGIGRGDRVAIVGLNSSHYLALDVAIGLVGAVSVPLYYTAPPAEVDRLVQASRSRLLFVGAPGLLERISELHSAVPLVSFCRIAAATSRPVQSWDDFLGAHAGVINQTTAPVGLDDLATIRYTSGTTGQPKGVTFTHGQLRWLAITLAGLLPWSARVRPATYLSFLPLNHVVEGLLATYGSYYLPSALRVHFLEDFRQLQTALRQVRPTIFFSVPRFYQKMMEAVRDSSLARLCLNAPFGGRLLRPLLGKLVLRQAGLDRCAQLIAGSAPVDEELLRDFHQLGIEIHDAYGQTEAPLITLNRRGANRIGTAGQPLPETELHITENGEILVRGPQVTAGYHGGEESPVRDGWLHTGDVGAVSGDGYLTILGRRKEFIATAYGKKVFPEKVEGMLREIPGVDEALLLGEGRPFCIALLWIEQGATTHLAALDASVREVNAHLSHPEQVKRWVILKNDLSIEGGQLTANLKLKRDVVSRALREQIEAAYADQPNPSGVLHIGTADGTTNLAAVPAKRHWRAAALTAGAAVLPTVAKRRMLEVLFARTADAFEVPLPPAGRFSYDERLRQYALFTRSHVDEAVKRGHDTTALQERLYQCGRQMGDLLRERFGIQGWDEAMALARVLYAAIAIDFQGTEQGDVTIPRCFLSRFYSAHACQVISSLDAGLLAGLSGDGQLTFSQRITEGGDCCRACLKSAVGAA